MINDEDPQDDHPGVLDRIARALGVPATTFLTAAPAETTDTEIPAADFDHFPEVTALLRLYVQLKSPEARARCLAYIVQEATRDV